MSESLLQDSDSIKQAINNVRNNVKSLEAQYKQALFAITPDQANKSSSEIERLTNQTNQLIMESKGKLEGFRQRADADPVRSSMSDSLTQKFADVIQQYQKAQTEYKDKIKTRMAQKFKIVKPDATPQEIDQAIEDGSIDKVFQAQTLDQNLHTQAKNALSYIQDRHRDIVMLEASIRELHQLFVDAAILVESSGVILDQIEHNVSSSVSDTAQGVKLMGDAVKQQKKSRKKMYILLAIILAVAVIILVPWLSTSLSQKT